MVTSAVQLGAAAPSGRWFRMVAVAAGAALAATVLGPVGPAPAAPQNGLSADFSPSIVKAGDDEGWVVGRSPRTPPGTMEIWRLGLDGGAAAVATMPGLRSPDAIGLTGGLAVAGLHCAGAGCRATVTLVDDRGALSRPATLWEQGAIQDGDGLRIAGSTDHSVFVSGRGRLYEVMADGTLGRTVAEPDGGGACVFDGNVYALVSPAERARGTTPRTVDVGPDRGPARTVVEIQRLGARVDAAWDTVAGGRRTFQAPGYPPTARCTATGIEVDAGVDTLLGRWTPATGWLAGAARPRATGAGLPVAGRSLSGVFARAVDGTIARRTATGAFERTVLSLPDLSRTGGSPQALSVDESVGVTVGCARSVPAFDPRASDVDPRTATGVRSACRAAPARPAATREPVSIAVTPLGGPAIAAPTAVQHHYNVCGSVCSDDQAEFAIAISAWMFNLEAAWSLSLNEACGTDFLDLARALNVNGTFEVTKRIAGGCPVAADRAFGNAVLHRGDKQDGLAQYLSNPGKTCGAGQPDDVECRAMLCIKVAFSGTLTGPCTAHLSPSSELSVANRQQQAREYIFIAFAYNEAARGVSLAGDFNLQPHQIPPVFPDLMFNGVIGNTYNAHDGPTIQLDYIWQERFPVNFGYRAYCDAGDAASDHCWTQAAWLF